MFAHNKRLMYTVRVSQPDPVLANMLLEQFGGPQGELAAAMRYFTQALAESDPGRKDMLLDIATEELSHLEVIGSIVPKRRDADPSRQPPAGPPPRPGSVIAAGSSSRSTVAGSRPRSRARSRIVRPLLWASFASDAAWS